jgi:hypothetical protein
METGSGFRAKPDRGRRAMRRIRSRGTVAMQRIMRLTVLVGAVSLAAGGLGRDLGRQHSAMGCALGFTLPTQSIVGLVRPVPVCARTVIFFQPVQITLTACVYAAGPSRQGNIACSAKRQPGRRRRGGKRSPVQWEEVERISRDFSLSDEERMRRVRQLMNIEVRTVPRFHAVIDESADRATHSGHADATQERVIYGMSGETLVAEDWNDLNDMLFHDTMEGSKSKHRPVIYHPWRSA